MKIKHRYYSEAQQLWDEIQEEERKAKLTEQERVKELERNKREVSEIIRKAEERYSMKTRVISSKRLEIFRNISGAALWLAKVMELDIEITTRRDYGNILLSTDTLILNRSSEDVRQVYESLLHSADEAWIQSVNEVIAMNFRYEFCDGIDQ